MKTTLHIADDILRRARKVAKENNVTLRSLVEEGLVLAMENRAKLKKYRCNPVTVGGQGLSPEFQEGGWTEAQKAVYKGRGT